MPGLVVKVLAGALIVYGILTGLAWRFQERLAFPAPRRPLPDPADAGFPHGERVRLTMDDGLQLEGWYLPPTVPPDDRTGHQAPGLVWYYGNMETVGTISTVLHRLQPPDTGVLVLDYRGYGGNPGKPTEADLYRDATTIWDWLAGRDDIDPDRIAVYGRSIGSVMALYVATHRPVRAVILDAPLSTAHAMARRHYPWLPRFLMRLSLDNLERAARLDVPLLVIHGARDRIAPLRMGRAVAAAGRAESLVVLPHAGHNNTYDDLDGYASVMHGFLARAFTARNPPPPSTPHPR